MHPLLKAGGRALAHRLDRLRETVQAAAERLRENLARLLGETLTDTVRQAFGAVLGHPVTTDPVGYPAPYGAGRVPVRYHDPYEDDPLNSWMEGGAYGYPREPGRPPAYEEPDEAEAAEEAPGPGPRHAWSVAAEVGLRVGAWCLRRVPARRAVLGGLAAGAVVAGAALLGGPWAVAGLRLRETLALLLS